MLEFSLYSHRLEGPEKEVRISGWKQHVKYPNRTYELGRQFPLERSPLKQDVSRLSLRERLLRVCSFRVFIFAWRLCPTGTFLCQFRFAGKVDNGEVSPMNKLAPLSGQNKQRRIQHVSI